MDEPQFFLAPDGTRMAVLTADRLAALVNAEVELTQLQAKIAAPPTLVGDPLPAQVAQAISEGANPIKAWRLYRGINQSELARRTRLTQPAIARLEQVEPGSGLAATIESIAKALDVPTSALAAGARAR